MNQETQSCQNCKQDFIIEPDDFAYYEKIGVLAPSMCPPCRAQRRLAFRNERAFYKRKCDRCGKDGVSMYSPNKPYTVWCYDCWFADNWDPLQYGRAYNPNRPFFEQFMEVWRAVPKIALMHVRSVNSDYINISADNKDCYFIIESSNNEGCTHCYWIQQSKDCVDASFTNKTELCYESDDCYNSFRLFYSKGCHDSHDGYFLLDCRGCSDCIGCINLHHKQYHILNQPYTKEEYEQKRAAMRLDTASGVEALRKQAAAFFALQPRKYAEIVNAPGCTGNYMKDSKNCRACFHCYDSEDSKYGVHVWRNAKDCVDVDTAGRNAERIFNSINAGIDTANYVCTSLCWTCGFMDYSYYCFNSNHCFGCAGLRKKDYCILNRQYSKEEYEKLRAEIVAHMRAAGEYGEFFPPSVSTFGYNESAACEQFPLEKEEALAKGFGWEDAPRGTFDKETISWEKVPDSIRDVDEKAMFKEVFGCQECKKNYLIIPNEMAFYKRLEIPLPRLCPDCRHARRFKARGPNRLSHRQCMCKSGHAHGNAPCLNEFETSYSPDRKEIVYCEECYQAEVV